MSGRILLKSKTLTRSRGRPAGKVRFVQFDSSTRTVHRDGIELPRLSPQEGTVLEMLATTAPGVIAVEAIERRLWPGRPPLSAHQRIRDIIGRLREVLGDSVENPCWIENVPGAGYVFAGTVEKPEPAPQPEAIPKLSPVPDGQIHANLSDGNNLGEAYPKQLTNGSSAVPLAAENSDQQPGAAWQHYWPSLLTFAIFAVFSWATWKGAYGLAVFLVCFGTGTAVLRYLHMPDTVYTRACVTVTSLSAMAYIPSASTLTEIMNTVVNAGTLRPALIYPFVTGLKFIPLFCLLLGYWTLSALFANEGLRKHPTLGYAYLLLGPVCLLTTSVLLVSASGDGQLWNAKVPGRWMLLAGYEFIFGVNVFVWIAGYRFFKTKYPSSYRQLLTLCGIAYFPVALAGAAVDHQYNQINRYYLDQRRPDAYVMQNPAALERWRKFVEKSHVGPDLQRLLDDPQFRRAAQTVRFYKQDFDEPFQVMAQTAMFGYKPLQSTAKVQQPFVIVRFPKELADALGFEIAFQ